MTSGTSIQIRNNLNQLITFGIKRNDGRMIGVQIDANAILTWEKLPDYGPEFDRLVKRKVLRLESDK
jgi:hypothetical protein